MRYTVVQDIPGRLRLRLGAYLIEKDQARGISRLVGEIEGVRSCEVHTANGSVLVGYDPSCGSDPRATTLATVRGLDVLDLPTAADDGVVDLATVNNDFEVRLTRLVVGRALRRLLLPRPLRIANSIVRSLPRIWEGVRLLLQGRVTVEVLDAAALAAALFRRSFADAGSISFLLRLSDILQDHVRERAKVVLRDGLVTRADTVWAVVDGQDVSVAMSEVTKDMVLHVRAGQALPVDGVVADGEGEVNEAAMTGEAHLVHKEAGVTVYAGTALEEGDLHVRVTAPPGRARIDAIVEMVEESANLKAESQGRAERMADALVPWSFGAFFAILAVTRDVGRAMAVLMVDYSCAIKLSTPIAMLSAMQEATEHDIVVKGGKYLEAFAGADAIVFDKTGTLTVAQPQVEHIIVLGDMDEDQLLRYAACIEEHFPHSVARAIVREADRRDLFHDDELHAEVHYVVAHGISTEVLGHSVLIGSAHFLFDDEGVEQPEGLGDRIRAESPAGTHIYGAIDGELVGVICVSDPVRPESAGVIGRLRELGIEDVVMLTGDSKSAAAAVARELGVDDCHAQVLPEDKSAYVQALKDAGRTVIMVGDGINDSPALAKADVSVALSDASDIARSVADVSVRDASLESLVTMRELSLALMGRVHGAYRFIVAFNTALIALGVAQLLPLSTAALLHNGSTIAVAAHNTTRLLAKPKKGETAKGSDLVTA